MELHRPYTRTRAGSGPGTCEFGDCKEAAAGELTDRKTKAVTRGCQKHLTAWMTEQASYAVQDAQALAKRPPSVLDKIAACTTPLQVHELSTALFLQGGAAEANHGTKKKWRAAVERKLQLLKGRVLIS